MEKQEEEGEEEEEGKLEMSNVDLPNDVLAGILTKLPARYLLQLRWVCKNWFSLISDPSFVKMHFHNAIAINHPLLVISNSQGRPRVDERTPYQLRPLGSCNGLLCISFVSGIHMRIWNPCTREFKDIPRPPVLSELHMQIRNPCTREFKDIPHPPLLPKLHMHMRCEFYGFGYDRINNDYKIVRNTCIFPTNNRLYPYYSLVDVYTLGTDLWKKIDEYYPYMPLSNNNGVFVSGGLHWIVRKSGVSDVIVIRFDVANEEYSEISIPQSIVSNETLHRIQLIELEGCLCILTNKNLKEMEVWRMKDYSVNEEDFWTKLFTVKEPIIDCDNRAMSFKVLWICKNGEVLVVEGSRDLVWYNPNTDKTRFITEIPDIRETWELDAVETCTCIESIVSLNSGTYMGRNLEEEDRLQFRILAVSSTSIIDGL